jgi:hypothetical protein
MVMETGSWNGVGAISAFPAVLVLWKSTFPRPICKLPAELAFTKLKEPPVMLADVGLPVKPAPFTVRSWTKSKV